MKYINKNGVKLHKCPAFCIGCYKACDQTDHWGAYTSFQTAPEWCLVKWLA